ncbi:PAAR domain-containing protein [Robbsia andropogonis]|uniref:PAAR domain-containing protein n=1 Tax=Robbsia andropogonis TaxID=28092 RepID=UPI003D252F6A
MRRRIAVTGDTLSSGGTVLPHDGPQVTMYGLRVALIGGPAFCSACKETGRIASARWGRLHLMEISCFASVLGRHRLSLC